MRTDDLEGDIARLERAYREAVARGDDGEADGLLDGLIELYEERGWPMKKGLRL